MPMYKSHHCTSRKRTLTQWRYPLTSSRMRFEDEASVSTMYPKAPQAYEEEDDDRATAGAPAPVPMTSGLRLSQGIQPARGRSAACTSRPWR